MRLLPSVYENNHPRGTILYVSLFTKPDDLLVFDYVAVVAHTVVCIYTIGLKTIPVEEGVDLGSVCTMVKMEHDQLMAPGHTIDAFPIR